MQLCESANHTYVSLDFPNVLEVKNHNQVHGIMGECIDKLLIEKELRKCKIIGSNYLGFKLPNGTYTGMLQSKKVDAYLKGEPDYLTEDWLYKTLPLNSDDVIFGHLFKDQNEGVNIFDLMENFNFSVSVLFFYLAIFLISLLVCFFINKINYRIKSGDWQKNSKLSSEIRSVFNSFYVEKISAIALFILLVRQFIWFNELFITNNIKTNKVVVDTSHLLQDQEDLFSTKRIACFLKNEQEMNFAISSPNKDNILTRIYNEKTQLKDDQIKEKELIGNEKCFLIREPSMFNLLEGNFYAVGSKTMLNFFLSLVSQSGLKLKIWVSPATIQQYSLVQYYNLKNSDNVQFFLRITSRYLESGISFNVYRCFDKNVQRSCLKSSLKFVNNLNDYIGDHSGFSDLELSNFQKLFIGYFFICSLAFFAFCFHHLINFTKCSYRSIKRAFYLRILGTFLN